MATSVSEDDERYYDRNHAHNLLEGLTRLRADSQFCDVEVCIGKSSYRAHRAVLSACSPYFQVMFSGGMRESHQDAVDIFDVEPGIFELLLDFMYTGYLKVEPDNVQDLLTAADMLQLTGVVSMCCSFLKTQLHPSNCLGILRFARSHACDNLATTCLAFACAYFTRVSKMEEFLELEVDDILTLLRSEELRVENEFEVFQAAMQWILHTPSNRRKNLIKVLEPVRFPIISQHQLFEYISECPDLSLRVALGKLLERFNPDKPQTSSPFKQAVSNPSLSRPRQNARKHLVIMGGYRRNPGERFEDVETLDSVVQLDTFTHRWTSMPSLQQPRHSHDVAFVNGSLYAIGGECDALIHNNVEMLDPVTKYWTSMPPLLSARCGHGVCTVDSIIYVLGGIEGSEVLNSIERFDEERGGWCLTGKMLEGRCYFASIEVDGLIYTAGGNTDPMGTEVRSLDSYNPITNEWNSLASMKHKRSHCGMGVLGDHLYIIGGANREGNNVLSSVEKYSIVEDKWTSVKHMSQPRASVSVAIVNGLIYVLGGRSPAKSNRAPKTLDTVECYDPRTNTWIDMGRMPTSRCEAVVAVI